MAGTTNHKPPNKQQAQASPLITQRFRGTPPRRANTPPPLHALALTLTRRALPYLSHPAVDEPRQHRCRRAKPDTHTPCPRGHRQGSAVCSRLCSHLPYDQLPPTCCIVRLCVRLPAAQHSTHTHHTTTEQTAPLQSHIHTDVNTRTCPCIRISRQCRMLGLMSTYTRVVCEVPWVAVCVSWCNHGLFLLKIRW